MYYYVGGYGEDLRNGQVGHKMESFFNKLKFVWMSLRLTMAANQEGKYQKFMKACMASTNAFSQFKICGKLIIYSSLNEEIPLLFLQVVK